MAEHLLHLPLHDWMALKFVGAETFLPTQFFSYMFLHANLGHLFSNMLGLFFLGTFLEMIWGPKRFLTFYLITGIGAGIVYSIVRYIEIYQIAEALQRFLSEPSYEYLLGFERKIAVNLPLEYQISIQELEGANGTIYLQQYGAWAEGTYQAVVNTGCVGASGCIFGILAGLALVMPDREILIFPIPFPIKMKYFAIFYFLIELKSGVIRVPGDNVAHYAHLGGALVAFLYLRYWERIRKLFS
jgi:membrane associated rhomboid family serine protease